MNVRRVSGRRHRAGLKGFLCALLATVVVSWFPGSAWSARVNDLYEAKGELPREQAFAEALGKVLVKVTGRRDAAGNQYRAVLFPEPSTIVQQYRRVEDDMLWVRFDRVAVRRVLDEAGQPVWGADRPVLMLWMAIDPGSGQRDILASADGVEPDPDAADEPIDVLRVAIEEAAAARGVPLILPLVDAEDLSNFSFAELWGDFGIESVAGASSRYGAEAILIGRSRSMSLSSASVRWTLYLGDERFDWEGTATEGPDGAADLMAGRLATYADSVGGIRVMVRGVDTLSQYGAVTDYLKSISIVEKLEVARIDGDTIEFDVVARADTERLRRTIQSGRVLIPDEPTETGEALQVSEFGRQPDLVFVLAVAP